jgi:multidrug efflux pump
MTERVESAPDARGGRQTVSTWVGSGVPRFYLPLDNAFPQTNVSQFIILPKDLKLRESLRIKLPALLATEFPEVRARASRCCPTGHPCRIRCSSVWWGPTLRAAGTR